jgi:hypothetical protein
MKRIRSIKIPPTGASREDLKGIEFHSTTTEDKDGKLTGGILYRAQERGQSILIQENEVDKKGNETPLRSLAFHFRPAEIEFEPEDDEEDEEGDGFELYSPLPIMDGEDLYD